MCKPIDAEQYDWKEFVKWAVENNCYCKQNTVVKMLWDCWKKGYDVSAPNLKEITQDLEEATKTVDGLISLFCLRNNMMGYNVINRGLKLIARVAKKIPHLDINPVLFKYMERHNFF